ncbi:MAG: HAD family hydrolase [Alphaproteobacteria bacterium]|nr:HAD family hydrolase [Alphaproteobacteria bacterium]
MKIKHVIFDWDGTLADTYPVITKAYSAIFEHLNLNPLSYQEIKELTSRLPNKDTLGFLFGKRKEEAKKVYYDYIKNHHTDDLNPIPYAKDLLDYCRDSEYKTYLLTNKQRPYLLTELEKLGFVNCFTKIIAAGDLPEDKPSQTAVFALFDNNLPSPNSVLVIGDGYADWQVACTLSTEKQKALCALYNPQQDFKDAKPDYLISDWRDLINILKKERA